MLTFHLMFGLCCVGRGECSSSSFVNGAPQCDAALSVLGNPTFVIALLSVRSSWFHMHPTLRSDMAIFSPALLVLYHCSVTSRKLQNTIFMAGALRIVYIAMRDVRKLLLMQ